MGHEHIVTHYDLNPATQPKSLEDCIDHCKSFPDCVAFSFYELRSHFTTACAAWKSCVGLREETSLTGMGYVVELAVLV